jgi:hypothetical protein
MNIMQTTDGSVCLWIVVRNSKCVGGWMFFEAQEPEGNWTLPYCLWRISSNKDVERMVYTNYLNNSSAEGGGKKEATGDAGVTFDPKFAGEGLKLPATTTVAPIGNLGFGRNVISGKFSMGSIWVVSESSSARGIKGRIPDVYFVPSVLPTGATLENDPYNPQRKWAVFGNIAVPWDGSLPLIA